MENIFVLQFYFYDSRNNNQVIFAISDLTDVGDDGEPMIEYVTEEDLSLAIKLGISIKNVEPTNAKNGDFHIDDKFNFTEMFEQYNNSGIIEPEQADEPDDLSDEDDEEWDDNSEISEVYNTEEPEQEDNSDDLSENADDDEDWDDEAEISEVYDDDDPEDLADDDEDWDEDASIYDDAEESKLSEFYNAVEARWGTNAVNLYKNYYLWTSQILFGESKLVIGVDRYSSKQKENKRIKTKIDAINKYRRKPNSDWIYGGYVDHGYISSITTDNVHCALCGAAHRYQHIVFDANEIDFGLEWWSNLQENEYTRDLVKDLFARANFTDKSSELQKVIPAGLNCTCDFYNVGTDDRKEILATQKFSVNEMIFLTPFITNDVLLQNALDDFDVTTDIFKALVKYMTKQKLLLSDEEYNDLCMSMLQLNATNTKTLLNFIRQFTAFNGTNTRLLYPRSLILRVLLGMSKEKFSIAYRYSIAKTKVYLAPKFSNIAKILPYILNNKSETDKYAVLVPDFADRFLAKVGFTTDSLVEQLKNVMSVDDDETPAILRSDEIYAMRGISAYIYNYFTLQFMGLYSNSPLIEKDGTTTILPEKTELWGRYNDLGMSNQDSRDCFFKLTGIKRDRPISIMRKQKEGEQPKVSKAYYVPDLIGDNFLNYPKTLGRFDLKLFKGNLYLNNLGESVSTEDVLANKPYFYKFSRQEMTLFIYLSCIGLYGLTTSEYTRKLAPEYFSVNNFACSLDDDTQNKLVKLCNKEQDKGIEKEAVFRLNLDYILRYFGEAVLNKLPDVKYQHFEDILYDILGDNRLLFKMDTGYNIMDRIAFGKPATKIINEIIDAGEDIGVVTELSTGVTVIKHHSNNRVRGKIIDSADALMKYLLDVQFPLIDKAKGIITDYVNRAFENRGIYGNKIVANLQTACENTNSIQNNSTVTQDSILLTNTSNQKADYGNFPITMDEVLRAENSGEPENAHSIDITKYLTRDKIIKIRKKFLDDLNDSKHSGKKEYSLLPPQSLNDKIAIDVAGIVTENAVAQQVIKDNIKDSGEKVVAICNTVSGNSRISDKQKYWVAYAFRVLCKHFEFTAEELEKVEPATTDVQNNSTPVTDNIQNNAPVTDNIQSNISVTDNIQNNTTPQVETNPEDAPYTDTAEWERLCQYVRLNTGYMAGESIDSEVNRILSTAQLMQSTPTVRNAELLKQAEGIIKNKIQAQYTARVTDTIAQTIDTPKPFINSTDTGKPTYDSTDSIYASETNARVVNSNVIGRPVLTETDESYRAVNSHNIGSPTYSTEMTDTITGTPVVNSSALGQPVITSAPEVKQETATNTNDIYARDSWESMCRELKEKLSSAKGVDRLRINSTLNSCGFKTSLSKYEYDNLVKIYNMYCK